MPSTRDEREHLRRALSTVSAWIDACDSNDPATRARAESLLDRVVLGLPETALMPSVAWGWDGDDDENAIDFTNDVREVMLHELVHLLSGGVGTPVARRAPKRTPESAEKACAPTPVRRRRQTPTPPVEALRVVREPPTLAESIAGDVVKRLGMGPEPREPDPEPAYDDALKSVLKRALAAT